MFGKMTKACYRLKIWSPLRSENFAVYNPQIGPLLERLVSASGGASLTALHDLFWHYFGAAAELDQSIAALSERGLIEYDLYRQRVVLHPTASTYLEQNAVMLGEAWDRNHAQYYLQYAQRYVAMPLERWREIDTEWGNIYRGADGVNNAFVASGKMNR